MIKAVIFDMDGTLLNTLTDLSRSVNFALLGMGYPPRGEGEVRRFIGNGVANLMRLAVPEGSGEDNAMKTLKIFEEHYSENNQVDTRPYPGVLEMLSALREKGILTAIVSNKYDAAVRDLNRHWFNVDVAIGESKERRRKPAPDMVFAALDALGARCEQAAYVGDTEVDYLTAKNSGCSPILVDWGYRARAELLPLGAPIASSAKELITLLD